MNTFTMWTRSVHLILLDLRKRFSFGLNLDDSWRYSGVIPPKSIIIPHLLSVSLPEGKILDEADDREIRGHGEVEPRTVAGRAVAALSDNLAEAKVDFVRCWFPWKYFEPFPVEESALEQLLDRSYSQWPLDDLVNTLTSKGVDVVPVVACGYQRMLPQGLEPDPNRTLYLKRASIHTRLLVRHWKSQVKCCRSRTSRTGGQNMRLEDGAPDSLGYKNTGSDKNFSEHSTRPFTQKTRTRLQ